MSALQMNNAGYKLIFNGNAKISGNNIRLFESEEEAKEYLISD